MDSSAAKNKWPIEWALTPLKKFAVFSGRAPRAEYWWFHLGWFILDRILSALDRRYFGEDLSSSIFALAILLPWIAVIVRRLHDTNRSGFWLLGAVIPASAFATVIFAAALDGRDAFEDPSVAFTLTGLATLAAAFILLIFMVVPGDVGSNRYGPDPYAQD